MACFVRRHPAGDVLQVYNVSDSTVAVPEADIRGHGATLTLDLLADRAIEPHGGQYVLRPYAAWWLVEGA